MIPATHDNIFVPALVEAPHIGADNAIRSYKISALGCEVIAGKNRCKSFTLKTLWTNWTLVSGTDF